jgi:hypothetical protein
MARQVKKQSFVRPRQGLCRSTTAQISPFCLFKVITAKAAATAPNGGSGVDPEQKFMR